MKFLLDTQVIFWLAVDRNRVPESVIETLTRSDAVLHVSVISAWEYGQKRKLRPQQLPLPFATLIERLPVERLDLTFDVAGYAESLPLIHRDPFDRMLVAQALSHGLTLVTSDKAIMRYPVPTLW